MLSEYYADGFKKFALDDFIGLGTNTKRKPRDFLRKRGVFVKKIRNNLRAEALYDTKREDITWPSEDPVNPQIVSDTKAKVAIQCSFNTNRGSKSHGNGTRKDSGNDNSKKRNVQSGDNDDSSDLYIYHLLIF